LHSESRRSRFRQLFFPLTDSRNRFHGFQPTLGRTGRLLLFSTFGPASSRLPFQSAVLLFGNPTDWLSCPLLVLNLRRLVSPQVPVVFLRHVVVHLNPPRPFVGLGDALHAGRKSRCWKLVILLIFRVAPDTSDAHYSASKDIEAATREAAESFEYDSFPSALSLTSC